MIKIISKIVILIILVLISISCSDNTTLQKYFVESENNAEILMVDIPTSLLVLNDDISANAKQALESIEKLNLLAFKLTDKNEVSFKKEKEKVKQILKNKDYQELLRVNDKGTKIVVKFLGSDEAMNEVIVYASDNSKGFALGRLLGDDMKPENMISLIENVKKMDVNSDTFKTLEGFFK